MKYGYSLFVLTITIINVMAPSNSPKINLDAFFIKDYDGRPKIASCSTHPPAQQPLPAPNNNPAVTNQLILVKSYIGPNFPIVRESKEESASASHLPKNLKEHFASSSNKKFFVYQDTDQNEVSFYLTNKNREIIDQWKDSSEWHDICINDSGTYVLTRRHPHATCFDPIQSDFWLRSIVYKDGKRLSSHIKYSSIKHDRFPLFFLNDITVITMERSRHDRIVLRAWNIDEQFFTQDSPSAFPINSPLFYLSHCCVWDKYKVLILDVNSKEKYDGLMVTEWDILRNESKIIWQEPLEEIYSPLKLQLSAAKNYLAAASGKSAFLHDIKANKGCRKNFSHYVKKIEFQENALITELNNKEKYRKKLPLSTQTVQ